MFLHMSRFWSSNSTTFIILVSEVYRGKLGVWELAQEKFSLTTLSTTPENAPVQGRRDGKVQYEGQFLLLLAPKRRTSFWKTSHSVIRDISPQCGGNRPQGRRNLIINNNKNCKKMYRFLRVLLSLGHGFSKCPFFLAHLVVQYLQIFNCRDFQRCITTITINHHSCCSCSSSCFPLLP